MNILIYLLIFSITHPIIKLVFLNIYKLIHLSSNTIFKYIFRFDIFVNRIFIEDLLKIQNYLKYLNIIHDFYFKISDIS